MSFKKNKYTIIKQAISKELSAFIANYFSMQKQVYDTCRKHKYFSPFKHILGYYEDPKTGQIPNTYSAYANIAMETLLLKCQPVMEKATGLKLYPAYTYARIYKKGKEGLKGIKVNLKQGDMLVYSGCELEHWREKFKGKECVQVFLHYNNKKTKGSDENMFDRRPHLGLPSWFKR